MIRQKGNAPIRIWALLGAHAGDNDQVIALAEAIGLPFEIKRLTYNRWRHAGPNLLSSMVISLTKGARNALLFEPPPDLTISAGHRSVPIVRALRRRSRGRTRSIHIGFPRVSPRHFGLVIATPQYPVPEHPNLLRIPYALTRVATEAPGAPDTAMLANLPNPRQLLIIGGPTPFWRLDSAALNRTLRAMIEEVRTQGGSVIATVSPRTPSAVRRKVAVTLKTAGVPHRLAEPGKRPSLSSLLAAADSIRVTADSVAMVSDAVWTRKPVAIVPVRKSALGRIVMSGNDAFRPGRRAYPQDLRFFWRALGEIGVTGSLAKPRTSPNEVMAEVIRRVRPILDSIE